MQQLPEEEPKRLARNEETQSRIAEESELRERRLATQIGLLAAFGANTQVSQLEFDAAKRWAF